MSKRLYHMEWLRAQMKREGYTSLDDVAFRVGIHRGNLYRYFTGENCPGADKVWPLSKVLGVEPIELLRALKYAK